MASICWRDPTPQNKAEYSNQNKGHESFGLCVYIHCITANPDFVCTNTNRELYYNQPRFCMYQPRIVLQPTPILYVPGDSIRDLLIT